MSVWNKIKQTGFISFAAQMWSFLLMIFLVNVNKSSVLCNLFTFTKEILNGKKSFFCALLDLYVITFV